MTTHKWGPYKKSSLSNGSSGCVEVSRRDDGAARVRDTKQRGQGPVLEFTPTEWEAFLGGVQKGEFTGPTID
jgi:hypothetical protein